jgi:hypothetical protein
LHAAGHAHHRGREHHPPLRLEQALPDDDVGDADSSSMVTKVTLLAEPGRWRISTMPASFTLRPSLMF